MTNPVDEIPDEETPNHPRRAIYLLPNLMTTAALFFGFYSVVQSWHGDLAAAAIAIFIAILFDGLDGRLARLTHTQSAFGAEYDSLSDMVSFGVAPAVLALATALNSLGKPGWILAFVYCAAAALRLARFNVNQTVVGKNYFQGLPSPSAAALVASFVWLAHDLAWNPTTTAVWCGVLTLFAGLSMVSNILFWSGKSIDLRRSVPFLAAAGLALVFAFISFYPPGVLFALTLAYALSGYFLALWRWWKKRHPLVKNEKGG
ncbi:CDP-diacylglycerol--serine O-phosphatidyltransferase [Hydrogenophilus thermoluteolus]|uniref:CDP-diacylglycerol--serine O-phosphatidyltransferase n=1 Tax=Hydrogenophilus thermoluteolus TaxID=297 RepID=A0A2Z6DZA5_HYDTE|nr:CDP-diacylglycerol--serine O-phosphatidyltransferase [Hydrogenophilus thermoluteolus]HCO77457.1 CDP-diacylglycerol--serine O-phosphatidyltransferase [Rhodocyclaceae bacterium]MBW7656987.1 CDP-diacylglycerol--serine O-phosphatidyltransferase [Hydrogenophilus thermoluteolus]BBD77847.1 CDP-diacylglycerol--serine O-phosphatidyltransferase [Hydrogenophilus thermoluteolus]GLW61675.1 CDP-diacylglycerol--serine O-phosphatidyltransferase [Hydrogenophilus thermoluteolus]HNQ48779.1 CDP-diacylglycerol-